MIVFELGEIAPGARRHEGGSTPWVRLSRCPITQTPLVRSVDFHGLDGSWWDNRNPLRPREPSHSTLLAFTGAVQLARAIEPTDHLVKPGPGVPFVIPRLLQQETVHAVISSLPIGRHQGFVVCYFADPVPSGARRANDWGLERYPVIDAQGETRWAESEDNEDDYDFELEPWMQRRRLSWIAPGDSELQLKSEAKECPYLGVAGIREIQRVQNGECWYPSLVDGSED